MYHSPISLEPLAGYLRPQFGNIYDYNLKVEGQFDVQEWTDELKQAIKDYLMHKAPENLRGQVLDELAPRAYDAESQEQQITSLMARYEPWEIAQAFHEAAVVAAPTLHALIGHLGHWPYENERMDAVLWLEAHATDDQLMETSKANGVNLQAARQDPLYGNLADSMVHTLEPPTLLVAWSKVVGPAPSDLTDDEWELLVPLLPKPAHFSSYPASWLPVARKGLDGIFYWFTNRLPWSHVPRRYGQWQTLYQRWSKYKSKGIFRRMYLELHDKPEAKRVVELLRMIDPDVKL